MTSTSRVLVTGAAGFIGRWSIEPLVAAGHEVHAVVSRAAGRELPSQLRRARVHRAELLDDASVDAVLRTVAPSHLLHFAWIATPGVYWTSPLNERWAAAGESLLRRFHHQGGRRVVMAGSCAEYDWRRVGVCSERGSPLADAQGADAQGADAQGADAQGADAQGADAGGVRAPAAAITPYAHGKLRMQRFLEGYGRAHGLSTAWGRIFFQFGPGEQRERLVASVIVHLLAGQPAACTHGRQVRSFLHVADVGAAFAALVDSPVEGAVNIGSAQPCTIAALVTEISRQIGRPELLRLGARASPPGEPDVLLPDVTRLEHEVGWRPRFSLQEGLRDTIAWWRGMGG